MLADPNATTVAHAAGSGRLVVADDGDAVLVLDDLAAAPAGQDLPGLGRRGQDARLRREPSTSGGGSAVVPIPQTRAGRRSRRGDDRGGRRRERADAAARSLPRACRSRRLGSLRRRTVTGSHGRATRRRHVVPISARTLVRMIDLRPAAPGALRVRRLPARAGGGRPRGGRGARHACADADGLRQVAHLPARRDAAAGADPRPLAADRADEGPGRQAARRDRRDGDVRQLVSRHGRDGRTDPRRRRRAGRGSSTRRPSGSATPRSSRRCGRSASASS